MKVDVKLFTVRVQSGYLCDGNEYVTAIRNAHPEDSRGNSHYLKYYAPSKSGIPSDEWRKMTEAATDEEIAELAAKWPYFGDIKIQLDEAEFLEYCQHVKPIEVVETKVQRITVPTELMPDQVSTQMAYMEQLLALNERCLDHLKRASEISWNEKCQAPVPGSSLVHIDRLMLCESPCTDALQGYLDAGWRIIAACPQPDSRRPDYILGKNEAATKMLNDKENGRYAERG